MNSYESPVNGQYMKPEEEPLKADEPEVVARYRVARQTLFDRKIALETELRAIRTLLGEGVPPQATVVTEFPVERSPRARSERKARPARKPKGEPVMPRVTQWLTAHPGGHTVHAIADALGLGNAATRMAVTHLERHGAVHIDRNGAEKLVEIVAQRQEESAAGITEVDYTA
jgi:hypothetical protein